MKITGLLPSIQIPSALTISASRKSFTFTVTNGGGVTIPINSFTLAYGESLSVPFTLNTGYDTPVCGAGRLSSTQSASGPACVLGSVDASTPTTFAISASPKTYTLSVTSDAGATPYVSGASCTNVAGGTCSAKVAYGANPVVAATLATGYKNPLFNGHTVTSPASGANSAYSYTLPAITSDVTVAVA